MPRINVDVPEALHRACKLAAATQGKTLKAFLIAELRAGVLGTSGDARPPRRSRTEPLATGGDA